MLQKISDRIQGWVAGIIIAIIAGVFSLWGIEYYINRGGNESKTVATVNGKKISDNQLKAASQQLQRRIQSTRPNKPLSLEEQKQIQSLALQKVITNTALILAAREQGFNVSEQQVQSIILFAPEFQVKGLFSPERFQQFLSVAQLTEQEFIAEVSNNFLTNQVSVGLENSAFVLPNDLNRAYQLIYQKRSFGYFTLPLSKFLKTIQVTEKEIQDYYNKNKDAYKTPESVKVDYLLLSPDEIEKNIKVSPEDLKAYYNTNKAAFTVPKQWKVLRIIVPISSTATQKQIDAAELRLQKIQTQIKGGQSFKSLMKQPGLISSMHVYTPTTVSTTLEKQLISLKPGQVSKPFHTDKGVQLIQLISVSPKKVKSFNEVKEEIKKRILRQQAQQILSQKSDELSSLTYTNPNTLSVAAKKLGLTVQTSPWMTKQGLKKGVFSNHLAVATAFSDNVLQDKNNSNPIDLSNGSVLVLRVNQYEPSKIPPLSEVKQTIQKVVRKNKAESEAGLQAYKMSSALGSGTSPQVLAKRYSLQWVIRNSVQRNDKTTPHPILISAFSTIPAKDKKISGVNTLVLANGDYVVLKVHSVKLADPSDAPAGRLEKLKKELTRLNGKLDYRLYAKSVMDRAKIHKN